MGFRIKNTKTGQLGWQVYATKREASASAKFHEKHSGVRSMVVNADGSKIVRRHKIEDNFSAAVRMWNFSPRHA